MATQESVADYFFHAIGDGNAAQSEQKIVENATKATQLSQLKADEAKFNPSADPIQEFMKKEQCGIERILAITQSNVEQNFPDIKTHQILASAVLMHSCALQTLASALDVEVLLQFVLV